MAGRDTTDLIDVCQAVPADLPAAALRDHLAAAIATGDGATYTDINGLLDLRAAAAGELLGPVAVDARDAEGRRLRGWSAR